MVRPRCLHRSWATAGLAALVGVLGVLLAGAKRERILDGRTEMSFPRSSLFLTFISGIVVYYFP